MTFINTTSSSLTIAPKYSTFILQTNALFLRKHNTIVNSTITTNGSIPFTNITSLPPNFSYFVEIYYSDAAINITNIACGSASLTKIINSDEGYACATFDLQGSINSTLSVTVSNTLVTSGFNACFIIVWQLGGI